MDLENGGGGALNNQQVQHQQEEEEEAGGGGGQLVTPDPAADYMRSGEIAVLCFLAVVLSSLGALLVGLAFGTIPLELDESGQVVFQSDSDGRAFVAELTCGVVALGVGCGSAAILALRCCSGSNSFVC